MSRFDEFQARKRTQYGAQWETSDLHARFIPYFNTGQRVEVTHIDGDKSRGYVGVTTGWKPAFLLLYNRRSIGSSVVLGKGDIVTRTFNARRY